MRMLPGIVILAMVIGCEKQREQVDKFVFDNSQIAYRDVHKYTFCKDDRIKADRRTSYMYMAGVPFDSTIYETIFEYNERGLLISELELPDSNRRVRMYNNLDSLVADYTINEFGDTTRFEEMVYYRNKVVQRTNRSLITKLPRDFGNIRREDLRNYDTLYFATDLFYDKGLHVKSLVHDKSGALSEEIEHYYKGSRCVKTITYAYIGDAKYVKETTYYLTDNESDYVTVGISGDTTAFTKTMEESHGKTVLHYTRELDVQDIWYYSNGGQLVVAVMLDIKAGERTVSKYIYDLKGNVIEEITYRERLTHGTI